MIKRFIYVIESSQFIHAKRVNQKSIDTGHTCFGCCAKFIQERLVSYEVYIRLNFSWTAGLRNYPMLRVRVVSVECDYFSTVHWNRLSIDPCICLVSPTPIEVLFSKGSRAQLIYTSIRKRLRLFSLHLISTIFLNLHLGERVWFILSSNQN